MVNNKSNTGSPLAGGPSTGGSSAGASSNPSGSTAGGGTPAAASASPGIIPGVSKAKGGVRTEVTAVANGIGTSFPAGATIVVDGQSYSQASLLAALQAALALYSAVDTAVQALKNQRLALRAALPDVRQLLAGIKAALVAYFGKGNPVLEAFGFNLQKPRQLNVEQKLARKEKAAATRKLRGTTGKRQKQGVKYQGQVDVQATLSSGTQPAGSNSSSAGAAAVPAGSNTAGAPAQPGTDASKS
ncbi:MAG: hypothetical protein ACYDCL_00440 [Myxococcales bacterium]